MEILKFRKDAQSEWKEIVAIKGEDGKTPVKGVDYFTDEEKQEIIDAAAAQGGGGGGSVDLTGYATEEYVDNAIEGIDLPDMTQYVQYTDLPSLEGYATEEYVDNAIANIDIPSGGGGSVAVDGVTIIQNDDGTISTAMGGGKTMVDAGQVLFTGEASDWYHDPTGNSYVKSQNIRLLTTLDATKSYKVHIVVTRKDDGSVEDIEFDAVSSNGSNTSFYVLNSTYFSRFQIESAGYIWVELKGGYYSKFGTTCELTTFTITSPPTYEYNHIDAGYIPVDGVSILYDELNGYIKGGIDNLQGSKTYGSLVQIGNTSDLTNAKLVLGRSNNVNTQASNAVALGFYNKLSYYANQYALGYSNKVQNGYESMALGIENVANNTHSFAFGYGTTADSTLQTTLGKYNTSDSGNNYLLIVGNGSSSSASNRANAFTLSHGGNGNFAGTVTSAGADYAEYFEWEDGNPEAEDRVGYIVALKGTKIVKAQAGDEVLGIISGTVAVLGDNYEWHWNGKYAVDNFGRVIFDNVEKFDNEGNSLGFIPEPRLSPDFDENKEYVNRANRAEWDTVGMFGKLFVRDDGSCVAGAYATVGADGVATLATGKTNMYIMERTNENIVRVLLK